MSAEKLCAWMTLCGSDIIALIASVKDLLYWLSCPLVSMPACLSTYLFAYFLLACFSVWLSTRLHTRVILFKASPTRHHLSINLPHCHDAPILDLLKEVCCLCFVYVSLPPALPLMYSKKHSTYCTHTADNTPIGLCWCTALSQSLCCLYPFIHLQSQLVPRCSCLQLIAFSAGLLQRFYDSTGGYA